MEPHFLIGVVCSIHKSIKIKGSEQCLTHSPCYVFPVMIIAIFTTITIITCSTGQTKTSQQSLSSPTWHNQGFLGTFYIPNWKKKKNHSPTHLSLSSETGGIWIHVERSSTQNFFICRLQTTDSNNKKWQIATTITNSNCWLFSHPTNLSDTGSS